MAAAPADGGAAHFQLRGLPGFSETPIEFTRAFWNTRRTFRALWSFVVVAVLIALTGAAPPRRACAHSALTRARFLLFSARSTHSPHLRGPHPVQIRAAARGVRVLHNIHLLDRHVFFFTPPCAPALTAPASSANLHLRHPHAPGAPQQAAHPAAHHPRAVDGAHLRPQRVAGLSPLARVVAAR